MEIKRQVRELHETGVGLKAISRALRISRNTVRAILAESETINASAPVGPVSAWSQNVDWSVVAAEVSKGTPIKTIHSEAQLPGVSYDAFRLAWMRRSGGKKQKTSQRLQHKPGEMAQVDYADGIPVLDTETGELKKTQLFCGVLPFSSFTFGEFSWNQKLQNFLDSHERMWAYFGGVTDYTVTDNLKAAVTKAHRYDPVENRTYCDFAKHWNFVVLPARPHTPRDKAAVESAIGAIQRSFYAKVRNHVFTSLHELNKAFTSFLHDFNNRMMKDHGTTRAHRFEAEKGHLRRPADCPFVMTEYRMAKVHPDCEIQVQNNFYSVPWICVGREVRVRLTAKMIEVHDPISLTRLTSHPRLTGTGNHSIHPWHYPARAQQLRTFDMQAVRKRAKALGPHVARAIDEVLEPERPLRMLRRAQGILRLSKRYSSEAVDYGCEMGTKFSKVNVRYVEACASQFDRNGRPDPSSLAPKRRAADCHLHQQQ